MISSCNPLSSKTIIRSLMVFCISLTIMACGGGGGGGGSTPPDTDGDGVADSADQCASTPSDETVDSQGCSATQKDDDSDGVNNAVDTCPSTPSGSNADAQGCAPSQKDDDADGVNNDADTCPGTIEAERNDVDAAGCGPSQQPSNTITGVFAAINAGGAEHTTSDNIKFIADTYSTGGSQFSITNDILGTEEDPLYQTERFGVFSYQIPLANATYDVKLMFAEAFFTQTGARVFNVDVESQQVESSLDLVATAGAAFTAYDKLVEGVVVSDGVLNIDLIQVTENPKISAILVTRELEPDEDEDSDGVLNKDDACFGTLAEEANDVDAEGCGPSDRDTDGDGVFDGMDTCPDTPAGELATPAGCSDSELDADNDGVMNDADKCDMTPANEVGAVDADGCGTSEQNYSSRHFVESDGILVVEMESTNYPSGWVLSTGNLSSGNRYLLWQGGNNFDSPGTGLISIPVRIQNPGIYSFQWRSVIGNGTQTTEHNDSWLKILSENFYGRKSNNHIVCPVNKDASNTCVGDPPAGSSAAGWLKIWRTGGPASAWVWSTLTSDKDGHSIYAEFTQVGDYEIQISGRSNDHGIDRFVLYRSLNAQANVDGQFATSLERNESTRAE